MTWEDCGMYWAWRGHGEPTSPQPTAKRLEYTEIHPSFRICCGVWDDNKYTPLHREEIAAHLALD